MSFAYFPTMKGNKVADFYLRLIGYPYPSRRIEAKIVFDLLRLKPGEKVLDIGCGEGIFTNYIAKSNKRVTGLDLSARDLTIARRSARDLSVKVKYIRSDAAKMPFKNSTFDKIFSISTIEHIDDDLSTFKESYRVLRPGGLFVFSVPLDTNPELARWAVSWNQTIKNLLTNSVIASSSSVSEYIRKVDNKFNHKRRYTPVSIKKKLLSIGFNIEEIRYNQMIFGRLAHNLVHTFRLFEWNKDMKSGYKFDNKFLLGMIFPLFIVLYEIDRILGKFITVRGFSIIAKVRK